MRHLDQIHQALSTEIAACDSRLRMLEMDRQEALTAIVVADHEFQALFDELSAAWTVALDACYDSRRQELAVLREDVLSVRITNHPSDLANGLISVNTPLAQALLGALVGDEASLHLPGRSRRLFRIISISKPEIATAASIDVRTRGLGWEKKRQ